jgi:hypothetical protein
MLTPVEKMGHKVHPIPVIPAFNAERSLEDDAREPRAPQQDKYLI